MALIYLVDDDPAMTVLESVFLKGLHETVCINSGQAALEAVEKRKPDLIILDIEMPFVNGYEVLRQLKGQNIPVLGLTGHNDKTSIIRFLGAGAAGYMLKPPSKKALLAKVEEILQKQMGKAKSSNVLLVERDAGRALVLKSYMENAFNVTVLDSAMMAIDFLTKYKPDVVVMDYDMPVYNGRFVWEYMCNHQELANVPLIFMVDAYDSPCLRDIKLMPVAGVLCKIDSKEYFVETIHRILGGRG